MSDYISREAVLKAFENADADVLEDYGDGTSDWGFGMQNIREVINSVPAADVEPVVRANWQFLSNNPGTVRCSNCGAEFEENPYAQYRGKWTGCPACRAKMQMIMDLEDANGG